MDERSKIRLLHHGGRGVANPTSERSLRRAAAVAGGPVERPVGKVPAGSSEAVASLWVELRRQNRHLTIRDRHALLEYCRGWEAYNEALAQVARTGGPVLPDPETQEPARENPFVRPPLRPSLPPGRAAACARRRAPSAFRQGHRPGAGQRRPGWRSRALRPGRAAAAACLAAGGGPVRAVAGPRDMQ